MTRKTPARELAITDFRYLMHPESVLTDRSGRSYLVFARPARSPSRPAPARGGAAPGGARRLAEWALYVAGGASMTAMISFGFLVPSVPTPPATAMISGPAAPAPAPAALREISLNVMRELRSMEPSTAR